MKGVDLVDFMGGMLGDMRDRTEQGWQDVSAIRAELEKTRSGLEQTRQEFSDYKAQQAVEKHQQELKQAKIDKKNTRRSWLQVIIPLVLSPLITLFIEHFQQVSVWFASLFH